MIDEITTNDRPSFPAVTWVKTIDFRPRISAFGLAVRNQGARGTCSVFASTFLVEYLASRDHGLVGLDLSEEYLNAVTNLAAGEHSDGNFFSTIASGYSNYGIVDEVWFPYNYTGFDPNDTPDDAVLKIGSASRFYTPSFIRTNDGTFGLTDSQVSAVRQMLDSDTPVAAGLRTGNVTTEVYNGRSIWDDLADLNNLGGHSMPIVGYVSGKSVPSGGYFIVRNSWAATWGDGGYGYLSFNYLQKHTADLVVYQEEVAPPFLTHPPMPNSVLPLPPVSVQLMDELGKLIHPGSAIGNETSFAPPRRRSTFQKSAAREDSLR